MYAVLRSEVIRLMRYYAYRYGKGTAEPYFPYFSLVLSPPIYSILLYSSPFYLIPLLLFAPVYFLFSFNLLPLPYPPILGYLGRLRSSPVVSSRLLRLLRIDGPIILPYY